MKNTLLLALALVLVGCSSSPYVYHVKPTQLQSNETKYAINSVVVNLELGHGAIPGDETFATQEQLVEQFTASLTTHMKDKGIYVTEKDNSQFLVDFEIDFVRTFNYGGKALNKPKISHRVSVSDNTQSLASFSRNDYTTSYGTFGDTAVSLEILASSWDEEDEPQDVDRISEYLIKDLAELGK